MVFVTVGTQLPFDRLIGAVQAWAVQNPGHKVVAQTGAGRADHAGIECRAHMGQDEFAAQMAAADVVVAHAGMGSILLAAEMGKPIIILPRRAAFGEHRNDHQLDTAAKMAVMAHVTVVQDAALIGPALDLMLAQDTVTTAKIGTAAQPRLLNALQEFIWQGGRANGPSPDMMQVVA